MINENLLKNVEDDRSDCQPEASSIAQSQSQSLIIDGLCFSTRKSIVHSPCLSLYFRQICKMQRVQHELVQGFSNNSLFCKQMTTFLPCFWFLHSQLMFLSFFRMSLQQNAGKF